MEAVAVVAEVLALAVVAVVVQAALAVGQTVASLATQHLQQPQTQAVVVQAAHLTTVAMAVEQVVSLFLEHLHRLYRKEQLPRLDLRQLQLRDRTRCINTPVAALLIGVK
jgi:hypothetical protein